MKILPFPGRQRMLCQRDGLRLQSERGRKEEMKRFFGGLLSSSHITWERMRNVSQILLHFIITALIFDFFPQAIWCSCFTGLAQCCTKHLFCISHVHFNLAGNVSLQSLASQQICCPSPVPSPIYVSPPTFCNDLSPNHSRFFMSH